MGARVQETPEKDVGHHTHSSQASAEIWQLFSVAGKLSQKADPDGETFMQERALKIKTYGVKMKEAGVSSEGQLELPITLKGQGRTSAGTPNCMQSTTNTPNSQGKRSFSPRWGRGSFGVIHHFQHPQHTCNQYFSRLMCI